MSDPVFRVFGLDRQLYGPVSFSTLQDWARDGRVLAESWVHVEVDGREGWRRAHDVDEIEAIFRSAGSGGSDQAGETPAATRQGVAVKALRQLKLFGDFVPEELEPFAREMSEMAFRPFSYIVRQGSHGDAMFFVVQGRVGVSTKGQVTESFLVSLNMGETFGEMSLFDPGPRSADVRAETDVLVLQLTLESLRRICREAPGAANRFLWNVSRMLASRVRAMDRRAASAKDLGAAGREAGPG